MPMVKSAVKCFDEARDVTIDLVQYGIKC
jgi:hypothetical protein